MTICFNHGNFFCGLVIKPGSSRGFFQQFLESFHSFAFLTYVCTTHFTFTPLDDSTRLRCYCTPIAVLFYTTVRFYASTFLRPTLLLHHCTILRIYNATVRRLSVLFYTTARFYASTFLRLTLHRNRVLNRSPCRVKPTQRNKINWGTGSRVYNIGRNVVGLPFIQHLLANFDKEKFFVILLKNLTLFHVLIVFAVAMAILVGRIDYLLFWRNTRKTRRFCVTTLLPKFNLFAGT